MEICHLPPRPNWREIAQSQGFDFHTMYGAPYWNEARAYRFRLREIEDDIEDPATELHAMCRDVVGRILASEELMGRMGLPRAYWDYIAQSWRDGHPELYGRMDLAYGGTGPAKLLEYNADTPTSFFESTAFQWQWLEDQIAAKVLPATADQFNGAFEALSERFRAIFAPNETVWFASVAENSEDYGTTEAIAWAAKEGGLNPVYLPLDQLGLTGDGRFADTEGWPVRYLFKLYPWEVLFEEPFAEHLATSGCTLFEPAWKALVSNKAILAMLWRFYPGHPNLLPCHFEDEAEAHAADYATGRVIKPLFSREGASVRILDASGTEIAAATDRGYDRHPKVVQAYHALPTFDGRHPVLGAWITGEQCTGLGLREDEGLITQNLSQFVPHFIED